MGDDEYVVHQWYVAEGRPVIADSLQQLGPQVSLVSEFVVCNGAG